MSDDTDTMTKAAILENEKSEADRELVDTLSRSGIFPNIHNHEIKQDKCPECGLRSDMNWPWCSPTGPRWGKCLNGPEECDGRSFARVAFDELLAAAG